MTYQYIKIIDNKIIVNDHHPLNTAEFIRSCFLFTPQETQKSLDSWLKNWINRKHFIRFEFEGYSVIITRYNTWVRRGRTK